jgi:hypothetical protein
MTLGEITSNSIAALSLAVAAISLWRSAQTDKRQREAIIETQNVWSSVPVLRDAGQPTQSFVRNPRPFTPEQRLVIAMEWLGDDRQILTREADDDVRLVLRPSSPRDDADADRSGNMSHSVLLRVENIGRWPATNVEIDCNLSGTFSKRFEEGVDERDFPGQVVSFDALAPGKPRYIEIRNVPGTPASLEFASVTAADRQPIRLVQTAPVQFQPRGYQ